MVVGNLARLLRATRGESPLYMDLCTHSSILLLMDVEENPRVGWVNRMEKGDGRLLKGMKLTLGGS